MNTTETLQQMQQLRLQGMYRAYHSHLELLMDQQLESHLIAQLVQSEQLNRAQEKTAMYAKLAKLRLPIQDHCLGMNRLIEKITLSKLDGFSIKLLNYLERQALIILDVLVCRI